jgi:hypothetical protein
MAATVAGDIEVDSVRAERGGDADSTDEWNGRCGDGDGDDVNNDEDGDNDSAGESGWN